MLLFLKRRKLQVQLVLKLQNTMEQKERKVQEIKMMRCMTI
jgi:hypothetical protein